MRTRQSKRLSLDVMVVLSWPARRLSGRTHSQNTRQGFAQNGMSAHPLPYRLEIALRCSRIWRHRQAYTGFLGAGDFDFRNTPRNTLFFMISAVGRRGIETFDTVTAQPNVR